MRILATLMLASILMVGCKKGSDASPQINLGINAKVDGTAKNFSSGATAMKSAMFGMEVLVVAGATSAGGESIAISVAKVGSITTGTYNAAGTSMAGGSVEYTMGTNSFSSENNCTVNITAIDATHVEGTFTATVVPDSGSGSNKTVTEGSFNVKF